MNWGEASESDDEASDTSSPEDTFLPSTDGTAAASKGLLVGGAGIAYEGSAETNSLTDNDELGTSESDAPSLSLPLAFMSMAKPLSRAVRAQLAGLLAEQLRLLDRIREKHGAIDALPQVEEVRKIMRRIPEYQKKLLWIKQSMGRTQTIVDQTKRDCLSLQKKASANKQRNTERKLAEARRDEELKAKVVTKE